LRVLAIELGLATESYAEANGLDNIITFALNFIDTSFYARKLDLQYY